MKTLLRMVAVASTVAALSASAQDDDFDFGGDEAAEAADEPSAEADAASGGSGEKAGGPAGLAKAGGDGRYFFTLPCCRKLVGKAEVLKPGATAWVDVEEGRFYPLGSSYRTTDAASTLVIQFGGDDTYVELSRGVASFGTHFQPIGEKTRTISLQSGVVGVKLPRSLPDGLFKVTAPSFTIVNPKGESRYAYTRTVDGDVAQVRCVTGTLAIEGRHFKFPALKAANEVKIRSSQDHLFTGLYGKSGDCVVQLDQGERMERDFSTDEDVVVRKPLEWKLSPKTAARIYRALPSIGERMSVTVMTFDASGALKNRCAFVEGRPEVNTGELGPVATADRDDLAKKAAAAADTVAVDVEVEDDEGGGEGGESSSDDASGEASSDDAGAGGDDDFDF